MSNIEIVDLFVETLLANPHLTIQAVQLRLSATDYEIKLLKGDPLKQYHGDYSRVTDGVRQPHAYQFSGDLFPIRTGEKGKEVVSA